MKTAERNLRTELSVRELGQCLNDATSRLKASVTKIHDSTNPLDSFDRTADIAVAVQGKGKLSSAWAVQIYVYDEGDHRKIELIALGDSGFQRAMMGVQSSVSLSKSMEKMDTIVSFLESTDSSLIYIR